MFFPIKIGFLTYYFITLSDKIYYFIPWVKDVANPNVAVIGEDASPNNPWPTPLSNPLIPKFDP